MQINFFYEFKEKKDLEKLNEINHKTNLYLACHSYKKFNEALSIIKNKNIKEIIYWQTSKLKKNYWISPYSQKNTLLKIFNYNMNTHIMNNIEINKNSLLFLMKLSSLFKNKKSFNEFLNDKEYPSGKYAEGEFKNKLISFFGINFDPYKYNKRKIKSLYKALKKNNLTIIKKEVPYKMFKEKSAYLMTMRNKEGLNKNIKLAKELGCNEIMILPI